LQAAVDDPRGEIAKVPDFLRAEADTSERRVGLRGDRFCAWNRTAGK
jgi:hypothetical protein